MGCCLSREGEEETEKRRPRSAYNIKDEKGQFKTSAHQEEFNASKWEEDTKRHKMRVLLNDQPTGKTEEEMQGTGKMQVVLEIILSIAENCQEKPELIEDIRNRYFEFVHEDGSGDLSQQLKSFLEEVVPEDSKLCSVLSLCHQKIVFPAYYSIKEKIHDLLAFKDSRGSWSIDVFLTEDTCTVVHSKIQMAKDAISEAEPEWSFRWELVISLSGENFGNINEVFVRIADVTTKPDLPADRVQQIRGVFERQYPPK